MSQVISRDIIAQTIKWPDQAHQKDHKQKLRGLIETYSIQKLNKNLRFNPTQRIE